MTYAHNFLDCEVLAYIRVSLLGLHIAFMCELTLSISVIESLISMVWYGIDG